MAVKTTPNSTTKETPFTLAFGHEAVIPAEIDVNTLRVFHFTTDDNSERLREDLDFIKEIKDEAQMRALVRHQQVANF